MWKEERQTITRIRLQLQKCWDLVIAYEERERTKQFIKNDDGYPAAKLVTFEHFLVFFGPDFSVRVFLSIILIPCPLYIQRCCSLGQKTEKFRNLDWDFSTLIKSILCCAGQATHDCPRKVGPTVRMKERLSSIPTSEEEDSSRKVSSRRPSKFFERCSNSTRRCSK